jgi:maltooligosyltrehalose trehalohydrolase
MLFQGQEFGASAPFLYFADHNDELSALVKEGRATFLTQFPSLAAAVRAGAIDDPGDPSTFVRSKLDWSERATNEHILSLHRDLLTLRREDAVFSAQRHRGVDGAVFDDRTFALRFFGAAGDDRLVFVNLGRRAHLDPFAEPLVAPGTGDGDWRLVLSTEDPRYGGWGTPPVNTQDDGWWMPAESAVVFASA